MSRMPEPSLTPPDYFDEVAEDEPSARELEHIRAILALIDKAPRSHHIAASITAKLSEYIGKVGFPKRAVEPVIRALDEFNDAVTYGLRPEPENDHG
jgi:endonuclease III